MSGKKDAAAIIASASRHRAQPTQNYHNHPAKDIWCETQWTNLSMQAKKLDLPELPYFDPATMLLSKEVNVKLWNQLVCPHPCLAGFSCPEFRFVIAS